MTRSELNEEERSQGLTLYLSVALPPHLDPTGVFQGIVPYVQTKYAPPPQGLLSMTNPMLQNSSGNTVLNNDGRLDSKYSTVSPGVGGVKQTGAVGVLYLKADPYPPVPDYLAVLAFDSSRTTNCN